MDVVDAVVIGGGIAGLSAARALLAAKVGRVRLLEREEIPCAHSSGRNAAIFRHLSATPGDLALARESRARITELFGDEAAWLRRTGTWFVAEHEQAIGALVSLADRERVPVTTARDEALWSALPALRGGRARHGVFCEDDGVIDIHAVTQALSRSIAALGGIASFGVDVARVERDGDRAVGVRLASGDRVAAGAVVIAAGAWGRELGATIGAPLPLDPKRRHLAQLSATPAMARDAPVVWRVDDEVYFRPESGGVLASPCDEKSDAPGLPLPDDAAMELLAQKLARTAPAIASAEVRRAWACLRTFAPDRASVVGPDPRVPGLHWLGGLGGHGMTGGVAAGEIVAARLVGAAHPIAADVDPARCVER
jgi:D-arginine dehydrogenase